MLRETGVSTTGRDTTPPNVQRNWRFYHTARHNTAKCSEKLAFLPHGATQHLQMFRETGVSTTRRDTTPPNVHKNRLFPSFSTPYSLIPPHGCCHPVGGKSVTVNYIVTMTEQSLPAVPQDLWNTNLCRAARA